jgi:hypothetical protein
LKNQRHTYSGIPCLALVLLACLPTSAALEYGFPSKVALTSVTQKESTCFDFAASELARMLGRIGIASEAAEPSSGSGWQLATGKTSAYPAESLSPLFHDAYVLETTQFGVTISSKNAKGILNGVYGLAERLGYMFLYPGEEGEWPPLLADGKEVVMPMGTVVMQPRFPHRGIFNGNASDPWATYYAKMGFNALCQPTERALAEKLGLRIEVGNHDYDTLIPPELFEEHPEYFRMVQPTDFWGERVGDFNLCVASPGAEKTIKKAYRTKIKELAADGIYAWNTWPEDLPGFGWCMCPTCRSFTPNDQAMIAMRFLAEVIREEGLPMRVPMLAYHDTMFPGKKIDAPKETFLLFAPRERCYGHALADESCGINDRYLHALKEWMEKYKDTNDAHTFEYYLDRVLFRGLFPFLPQVILDDTAVYEKEGIESHITLHTGSAFEPRLMMLNLPVFAQGQWDDTLDAKTFIAETAAKILPANPNIWVDYYEKRATVSAKVMQWEDESVGWADYRWFSETTLPIGKTMLEEYRAASVAYAKLAADLEAAVTPDWPDRVKALAETEVLRTRFESAELHVMTLHQDAMNNLGDYMNTGDKTFLREGVKRMRATVEALETARKQAEEAGQQPGTYYFMFNTWVTKELNEKIAKWTPALP